MPRGYNIDKLNRKELIAIAKYNTKLINESFKALQGWNEKETIDYIKEKNAMFASLTKTKNIDRYKNIRVASGNLSRMNKKQIRKIIYKQKLYLNSKWSSPEGREEIFEKQYQTLKNTYMGLTRENVKNFQQFMAERTEYVTEIENQFLPSSNLMDLTRYYQAGDIVKAISDLHSEFDANTIDKEIGKNNFKNFIAGYIVFRKNHNIHDDTNVMKMYYDIYKRRRKEGYEDL